jgi:hypothetical protein
MRLARTDYLPGMEGAGSPHGLREWDAVLWQLTARPGRRVVMLALRALSNGKETCYASNASIRAKIRDFGFRVPSDRKLRTLLRLLEKDDRVIERQEHLSSRSQRRIHLVFVCTPDHSSPGGGTIRVRGGGPSGSGGGDHQGPPRIPKVVAAMQPAPRSSPPLNTRQEERQQQGTDVVVVSPPSILEDLKSRGLSECVAEDLARSLSEERVRKTIAWVDWLRAKGDGRVDQNPAGFLTSALRQGWAPPADYVDPATQAEADRLASAQAEADRLAAEAEARELAQTQAREVELRQLWEELPESDRASIRYRVAAENPGAARWPAMVESLCLGEVEKLCTPLP